MYGFNSRESAYRLIAPTGEEIGIRLKKNGVYADMSMEAAINNIFRMEFSEFPALQLSDHGDLWVSTEELATGKLVEDISDNAFAMETFNRVRVRMLQRPVYGDVFRTVDGVGVYYNHVFFSRRGEVSPLQSGHEVYLFGDMVRSPQFLNLLSVSERSHYKDQWQSADRGIRVLLSSKTVDTLFKKFPKSVFTFPNVGATVNLGDDNITRLHFSGDEGKRKFRAENQKRFTPTDTEKQSFVKVIGWLEGLLNSGVARPAVHVSTDLFDSRLFAIQPLVHADIRKPTFSTFDTFGSGT